MKAISSLLLVLAATAVCLSSGCASFESRTEEKAYVFDSLTPATKQRLKDGEIRVGDSFDMVYIALGAPDEKHERTTRNDRETVWVYASYDRRYEGEAYVGYRRVVTRAGLLGGYHVHYEPVSESTFSERSEERFRVTFENGAVSAIETSA